MSIGGMAGSIAEEKLNARFALIKETVNLEWLMEMHPDVRFVPDDDGNPATRCIKPDHADKRPSLKIHTVSTDPYPHWKCWPCDIGGTCIGWVKLTRGLSNLAALEWLEQLDKSTMPEYRHLPPAEPKLHKVIPPKTEARHHYLDAKGELLCTVARYPYGRDKAKVLTFVPVTGGYLCTRPDGPFLPYLAEMLAKSPEDRPIIVEGENTADALRALGMNAFSWIGGSAAVNRTDWSVFAGREVDIVADRDNSGRVASQRIADLLVSEGCTVRLYTPPGHGGDDIRDDSGAMESAEAAGQWIADQPCKKLWLPSSVKLSESTATAAAAGTSAQTTVDLGKTGSGTRSETDDRKEKGKTDYVRLDFGDKSWRDNKHYKVLGMWENDVAIYQRDEGRTQGFTKSDIQDKKKLNPLYPNPTWWMDRAGGPLSKTAAAEWAGLAIIQAARNLGAYDDTGELHPGCHLTEDGRVWLHMGHTVRTPEGRVLDAGDVPYGICIKGNRLGLNPATGSDNPHTQALWRAMSGYRWRTEADMAGFMGWLPAAVIGGALRWRAHVWLTAPSESGKSFLLTDVLKPLVSLFGPDRCRGGGDTVAAFRNAMCSSRWPLIQDEAYDPSRLQWGQDMDHQGRQDIIRRASDGEFPKSISRGAGRGNRNYLPRCGVFQASTEQPRLDAQDATRFTTLRFSRTPRSLEVWTATKKNVLAAMEHREAIIAEMLGSAQRIYDLTQLAIRHCADTYPVSTRMTEQVGALAAGAAWSRSAADAEAYLPEAVKMLLTLTTDSHARTAESLWETILSRRPQGRDKSTVAYLLANWDTWHYSRMAREYGIALDGDYILVNPAAPALMDSLKDTEWAQSNVGGLLKELSGDAAAATDSKGKLISGRRPTLGGRTANSLVVLARADYLWTDLYEPDDGEEKLENVIPLKESPPRPDEADDRYEIGDPA